MTERTITLCGKEVGIAYCMATEQGFEEITGKSFADFDPAKQKDLLSLLTACVIAYAQAHDIETPITAKDILFTATPEEIGGSLRALAEIRGEWYGVPATVEQSEPEDKETEVDSDDSKNA